MQLSKAQAKALTALTHKKYRLQRGEFLVEGVRLCEEALVSRFGVRRLIICRELLRGQRADALVGLAEEKGVPVFETDRRTLERISETVHSQGVIAVCAVRSADLAGLARKRRGFVVILDQVSDPGNVGTILRTAAWFGARGAILGTGTVEWTNPKVVRASAGALFHLPVVQGVETEQVLRTLRQAGFALIAADVRHGEPLHSQPRPAKVGMLLGSEAHGVRTVLVPLVDRLVHIPRRGYGDSLNVAVAAGILMAEIALTEN
jgi:TrmH family RNA methyltransferase